MKKLIYIAAGLNLPVLAYADLNKVPGMTEPQAAAAAAIQTVCPKLAQMQTRTAAQTDLFFRCREMIQTSNAQQGVGPTQFSLGLSEAELRNVLQLVAPEEAAIQGSNAMQNVAKASLRAVGSRLSALRRGARGVKLSAMELNLDGKKFSAARLFGTEARGGAASADSTSRIGAYANVSYNNGDRSATSREDGFDFDGAGITLGADYRFTDNLVAGVAANYNKTDVDIALGLGNVETQSNSLSLYGTYYTGAFYVDGHANFGRNEYDTSRTIVYPTVSRVAKGSTDGNQYTLNLGAGYDIARGSFTFTPYGRIEYLNLKIDGYSESGADGLDLLIEGQRIKSLQSALGVQASYSHSASWGILTPQLRLEWIHEFKNNNRGIVAKYVNDPFDTFFAVPTDDPDRNYFGIGAGVSATFPNGVSAFINYETVQGLRHVDHHSVMGGVRLEF